MRLSWMLEVGVLSEDSLRERYSMLRQNVLASTLMRLVPSGKGTVTGTFILHCCTVTVSPGMADLSGHTACPGRI